MIFQADAALIPFADKTFHACVTSPPYWGLRKYAGEQERGMFPNLGLEPTPQEHIQHIVEIFREVYRVLRDDGVVWLNYGDCYAGSWGNYGSREGGQREQNVKKFDRPGVTPSDYRPGTSMVKLPAGNLMLMPHRIAIALQDDGWIVRNDLIWWKRNPMPESCAGWRFERSRTKVGNRGRGGEDWRDNATETPQQRHAPDGSFLQDAIYEYGEDYELRKGSWRHTRAHEYIFMLTKRMQYWCNQEAVREAAINEGRIVSYDGSQKNTGHQNPTYPGSSGPVDIKISGRNPRSVLDVPTAPYKGAHYATFPPNLIAPLIRASCPRRACPECGQGWSPVVEKEKLTPEIKAQLAGTKNPQNFGGKGAPMMGGGTEVQKWLNEHPPVIKSYRPTCECGREDFVPGIILDPFIGSGTTGAVARELQRRWAGLDISMEYLDEQAKVRALNWTPSNALEGLPLFEKT